MRISNLLKMRISHGFKNEDVTYLKNEDFTPINKTKKGY